MMNMDRRQIIENTTSLLKKYGLKSMTIDEISCRLGISKTSFYEHFATKEELLLECLAFMNEDIEKLLVVVASSNARVRSKIISIYNITVESLSQFNSTFYFDLKKKPELKSMVLVQVYDYRSKWIRPLLQEAKNENLLKTDIEEAVDFFMKFTTHFFSNFKDDPVAISNHLDVFLTKYLPNSVK
ncbi:MAG TPA: TetR/AcrR family transcriptional regulator [Flavobacterium sp.]|jgi:AcrR family transcriptional regulator